MPIHDWSRVDANIFHDFHQAWAMTIRNRLNDGLLPSGYSALVEQHAGGLIPDVLTLERRGRMPSSPSSGGTLLAEPPRTAFTYEAESLAARGNQVAIHHRLGDVVCIIEIVSPGNKSSGGTLRAFVKKAVEFLDRGVNLLIVDLLPPGPRDPDGIHGAIWKEFAAQPFDCPISKSTPLTLAAYVASSAELGLATRAFVEPVAINQELPNMPAYLDAAQYVPVPLEATYLTAWKTCPSDMRHLVETGKLPDE